jgi:hypothetical protein
MPNRPFAEAVWERFGDSIEIRRLDREDASGITCRKANELLGYRPTRTWRDYLDDDGRLLPEARERLEGRGAIAPAPRR